MRVFPYKNMTLCKPITVHCIQSDQFMMELPCVLGYLVIDKVTNKSWTRKRPQWFQLGEAQLHHVSVDRSKATVIHTRQELDQILSLLSQMKGIDSVFIEPLKEGQK